MYLKTRTRVDAHGKIAVPKCMREEIGLKEGSLVEMETRKGGLSPYVTIKQYAPYPGHKVFSTRSAGRPQGRRS